jgi:hypothetical protein
MTFWSSISLIVADVLADMLVRCGGEEYEEKSRAQGEVIQIGRNSNLPYHASPASPITDRAPIYCPMARISGTKSCERGVRVL